MAGRPNTGMGDGKITLRVSEKQSNIVRQYCLDHEKPEHSTAVRAAIDFLGDAMNLSDNIETSCANLLDIAKVFEGMQGETAPIYSQAIQEAAALLWIFCYKKHLPDEKQLEEQRQKDIKKYVKAIRRENNNVGQNKMPNDKSEGRDQSMAVNERMERDNTEGTK